jgi:predicted transcriptional regulator
MAKTEVLTTRVTPEIMAMVDRIAASKDRSRAWVVAWLVEEAASKHVEFLDFVQVGLDDVAAGRTISHDDMMARLRDRWSTKKAA